MHRTVTYPVCFDSSIVGARWLVCFWKNIPDRQPDLGCIANAAKMALTDDTWADHSLPRFRSLAKPLKSTSPRFEVMTLTSADNTWRGLYDCFPCRRGWEVHFCLGNRVLQSPPRGPWALTAVRKDGRVTPQYPQLPPRASSDGAHGGAKRHLDVRFRM